MQQARHELGATGLKVSPLGLGLAALGRPGYLNIGHHTDLPAGHEVEAMERHAHAVLDAAWQGGVRYFDVARSYGRAEQFLHSWLTRKGLAPGTVTVGSKWGYTYTAGWRADAEQHEVKDHSVATLRRQREESLAALGEHLRLYQIHSATLDSGVLDDAAVLDELARLRARGVAVGVSVSGPRQAETIRKALEVERGGDGGQLFSSVQATWNVLEPSAAPALSEARQAGLGVILKEVLANGRLTQRGDGGVPLAGLSRAHEVTPDAIAIAAALAQPWADVVLSGASTVGQLRANLAAAEVALTTPELERLDGVAEDPETYWSLRASLPWT